MLWTASALLVFRNGNSKKLVKKLKSNKKKKKKDPPSSFMPISPDVLVTSLAMSLNNVRVIFIVLMEKGFTLNLMWLTGLKLSP